MSYEQNEDIIKKKSVSTILPTLLFMIFDYVGVIVAEHLAFILRDSLDFWNHAHYCYDNIYMCA